MSNFDEIFIKAMKPLDAYNYGRQKAEKELNAIHLCECNHIKADAYKQGKADAIEEILSLIKDIRGLCRSDVLKELIQDVEQLKENNNDVK